MLKKLCPYKKHLCGNLSWRRAQRFKSVVSLWVFLIGQDQPLLLYSKGAQAKGCRLPNKACLAYFGVLEPVIRQCVVLYLRSSQSLGMLPC